MTAPLAASRPEGPPRRAPSGRVPALGAAFCLVWALAASPAVNAGPEGGRDARPPASTASPQEPLAQPQAEAPASGQARLKKPDMSKPPAVEPHISERLPFRMRWRLPNGFETVLVEDGRLPLVTARLVIRSGWAAVPSDLAGLADAMAELLTEGTVRRTAREIADAAQDYGGRVSAKAGPDSIVIEASCLSDRSERMLALLAEVARFPTFPWNEVQLRKKNMKEELLAKRADDDFLSAVAFFKRFYRSHPYAVTAPTEASIAAIGRKHIVAFHKKLFTPRNATLVLVGDIGYEVALKPIQAHFGQWKGVSEPVEAPAVIGGHDSRKVYLVDRPGSSQVTVFMGNFAVRPDHPQYYGLLAAGQVLGGSFSSRLTRDIRESKGWTYQIWSRLDHRLTSSIFQVRSPLRSESALDALKAVFRHLEGMRDRGVTEAELEKAKGFLVGGFAVELETQAGLADALVTQKILRLPDDYYDSYADRVAGVTAESVGKAAQTFIRPEEMTVVVVGEAAKLKDGLAKFSEFPVIVVDQDGN
ncbi:MAG: insulinase family protein [Elusimicrobia bacterium]|nr:insulinase family protein [Elusimicrobiota bacterium]